MKKIITILFLVSSFSNLFNSAFAQNVGVGILAPLGKLHVKGSADTSQFIIDANISQSNTSPLINLRKSDGTDLMWIHSDDILNTFIGVDAGRVNNAAVGGIHNIFIGNSAGYFNTTGNNNTANGIGALASNTTASQNIAIGNNSLFTQSYNNNNTPWISGNVAIGYAALYANQPTSIGNGHWNTAVGHNALFSNTTGSENTADGFSALKANTIGNYNTANGSLALFYNTKGNDNTANGVQALLNNTTASQNTAIGNNSLFTQSYNNNNTPWVSGNVAVGYNALYSNQPTSTSDGYSNIAVGNSALTTNTTGWANTGNGNNSLYSNTNGYQNVANGYSALYSNTIGYGNTAIGLNSLYYNVEGYNNTALGISSGTAPGTPNLTNTVSVGNHGYYNGASNQAFIGNLSTLWSGGNTTWFTYASDGRVKKNVKDDVQGLEFISRLRPVTYNLDITAMRTITGNAETVDYPGKYDVEKIKHSGFIAQEVEQAAFQSGYSFSGVTIPRNENELYTMSYSQFVVPLVKAVQELSAENHELTTKSNKQDLINENLKSENEKLTLRIEKIESLLGVKD